jgi:hypothetical protein
MRGMKRFTGMSRVEWMTGSLAAVVLGLTLSAALGDAAPLMAHKSKAIRNCRMILVGLRLYASDHDGNYSDKGGNVSSSNQAFRRLFSDSILETEEAFVCPDSIFAPDGNVGSAPDFSEALKPGENHWAMTAGLTDVDLGNIPLVYGCPVKAEWPAKWNTSTGGVRTKGQAWSDGTVIVGTNDTAARVMNLVPAKAGTPAGLEPDPHHREEVFNVTQQYTILDVEPAKAKP